MLYRKLKSPVSIQIEITEECNNSCLYCYNHWRFKDKQRNFLSIEKIEKIIPDLVRNEVFEVTITGGEPLIRRNELMYLVRKLKENGISFTVNTNLRLLTEEYAEQLLETGAKFILTSLNSFRKKEHDYLSQNKNAFSETIKGIKVALKWGFVVGVNVVLTKVNLNQLFQTAEYLSKIGVKHLSATKVSPCLGLHPQYYSTKNLFLNKKEILESLQVLIEIQDKLKMTVDILECYPLCLIKDGVKYKKFIRRNCGAGINTLTIGASGDVRPCSHSNLVYGNIFQESLEKIWGKMDDWRSGKYIPKICRTCPFFKECTAGCRMDALFFGKINEVDPYAEPLKINEISLPIRNHIPEQTDGEYFIPFYKFRKEIEGYFIFTGNSNFLVNETGFKLLEKLKHKVFPLNKLPKSEKEFLIHLIEIGFIKKYKKEGGDLYESK